MSKAIMGAVELGLAAAILVAANFLPGGGALVTPLMFHILEGLALGGISMEAGAIAGALTANRGMGITTRQPASFRQVIYGEQRVGGIIVYQSTTGSHKDQYNFIIVLAGHEIDSIVNLYLDGRQVFWASGVGNVTRNGVNFGGTAASGTHIGPDGTHYDFGGSVYCEARFGDQAVGDVIGGATANDPIWGASSAGSPYGGGCAYVYLKLEYNTTLFPNLPEIKFTVRGWNQIYDPRTGTKGYSTNWALQVADVLTNPTWGLNDGLGVNQAQLIAAANVCDEQVTVETLSATESRYCCHFHDDMSVDPANRLQRMMSSAQGRLSRIGGEYFIWPAYWQGPSFTFDADALTGPIQWDPYRSLKELCNRVNGTYIAANYPFNAAGDLYDANGWYDGTIENNFPFAFQPTNYPQYAQDSLHGYAADEYLNEDSGVLGAYDGTVTYSQGDVVTLGTVIYQSQVDSNLGNTPSPTSTQWVAYQNLLPKELVLDCCLSVTQAQRLAKIWLMRNRQQGSGTFPMAMSALEMQPVDVMSFTFDEMGWAGKSLEIAGMKFAVDAGERGEDGTWTSPPNIRFEGVNVIETDPSVYEWDPTTEELTVYDVPALPTRQDRTPAPPTSMTLTSSAATAITGADGVIRPRVEVQWTTPADVITTSIQVQYQSAPTGGTAGPWTDAGSADVNLNQFFVQDVVAGHVYNFRIRSVRPSGATSSWEEIDGYTVSLTLSIVGSGGMNPNSPYNVSNNATVDSIVESAAATIRIYGPGGDGSSFTRYVGATALTMSPAHITGKSFTTSYFIVYDTGSSTYLALTDYNSTLADAYVFIGSVVTCASTYTGTGGGTGSGGTGGGGGSPGGGRLPITQDPD